jgi:DNA-binding GntR family transcriptional regulator
MERAPKRLSLTEFAVEQIRRAILNGDLAPNSFTTAEKLASEMDMSRTPVREALLRLEQVGMVRIERNQGVTILPVTTQDLEDAFQLRFMLEVPAAYSAAERAGALDKSVWENLQEQLDSMRYAAKDKDYTRFMESDLRFHELIHLAAGNSGLARVVRELRQTVTDRAVLTDKRLLDQDALWSVEEHERVRDAVHDREPVKAATAMSDHLTQVCGRILKDRTWTDQAWFNPLRGLFQLTAADN